MIWRLFKALIHRVQTEIMAKKRKRVVKKKGVGRKSSTKGKKPRSPSGKSKDSKVRKLMKLAKLRNKQKKGKKNSKKKRR